MRRVRAQHGIANAPLTETTSN